MIKKLNFSVDLSQLPCGQSRFDLIRNLFELNLMALSCVKQTMLLSSGKKKNMLGKATRSLEGSVSIESRTCQSSSTGK